MNQEVVSFVQEENTFSFLGLMLWKLLAAAVEYITRVTTEFNIT